MSSLANICLVLQDDLIDDSPESPDAPEDLPYVSLKRFVDALFPFMQHANIILKILNKAPN